MFHQALAELLKISFSREACSHRVAILHFQVALKPASLQRKAISIPSKFLQPLKDLIQVWSLTNTIIFKLYHELEELLAAQGVLCKCLHILTKPCSIIRIYHCEGS